MKTIKFYTLGCKVNQYDTQSIRERFLKQGFKEIYNGKKSGFYLINTCTVTAVAERKSKEAIRRCIKANPKAEVIVTGCLVEKDNSALSGIKGVSHIIAKRFFPEGISDFSGHTRAFLKVQDGCNNFCSYCRVPLVRGASRSRPLDTVVNEAEALVKKGFKEIVLTGICLGAYGRDMTPKLSLVELISALEKISGLLRLRLSSIEAIDVTEALIAKMKSSKKLCPHLHIPIQSGDDEILKKMNRRITRAGYLALFKKIKKTIPHVAITTDILVGFPAETEKNFQNSLRLIKALLPLRTHIFAYSRRPGTRAANFMPEVGRDIVKKRILSLRLLMKECSLAYRKKFLNKKMTVLAETRVKDAPCFWQGYTANYIMVRFKSKQDLKNKLVPLNLKQITPEISTGQSYD